MSALSDARGVAVTACSREAADALDAAIASLVAHRADLPAKLDTAQQLDPDLLRVHVMRGFGYRLLGRRSFVARAAACLAAAQHALALRGATPSERCLVAALAASVEGDTERAASALEAAAALEPRDLLAIKLSHALHFILGRSSEMRRTLERVMPAWADLSLPGSGALRGCLAFALVETGETERAEPLGRLACELEPNVWSVHAVSHAHYTRRALKEGTSWLAAHDDLLDAASNLGLHLRWHAALFAIARGAPSEALDAYDRFLAPRLSPDYRDFVNASSLLVRLEAAGVDVGARWQRLAEVARTDARDHQLGFAGAHFVLALLRAGHVSDARALLADFALRSAQARDIDGRVEREVAVPLCDALLSPDARRSALVSALAASLPRLGGSRVQREVFTIVAAESEIRGHAHPSSLHAPRS